MTDHHADPDADRTIGRPHHRQDLAEDFRRLDAAQRAAAAAASPTARALIEASRAATYNRLAPLVADLDRTWTPATPSTLRSSRRDWYTRSATSPEDIAATDTVVDMATDTDGTELIDGTNGTDATALNRNRIIEVVVKAAHVIRHPRRQRQG